MANPDGTTTTVDNKCYANGIKVLLTQIRADSDGGASHLSTTIRRVNNGTVCYTESANSTQMPVGGGSNQEESDTTTYRDGSGALVVTINVMITSIGITSTGTPTADETETMQCPGMAIEPLQEDCLPPSSPDLRSLTAAGVICTPGSCT